MTTELEKQFFETFEIKLIEDGTCDMDDECRHTDCSSCQRINKFNYPPITDRILLELICILSKMGPRLHIIYTIKAKNTLKLKQDVLKHCLGLLKCDEFKKYKKDFKQQVQELFKEK